MDKVEYMEATSYVTKLIDTLPRVYVVVINYSYSCNDVAGIVYRTIKWQPRG